jgi:hypothetical protein
LIWKSPCSIQLKIAALYLLVMLTLTTWYLPGDRCIWHLLSV